MAGADAVHFIRDQKRLGEIPAGIIGCFSGTLGYVTSELEKGRNFSEIIREAKERGYTEPNPTVDLSGKDVAYKILILARTAGFDVSVGDIKLSPFIPLDNIPCDNVDLLLEGLKTMDEKLKNDMNSAKANGKTLRYIARTATKKGVLTISVGLENVDKRVFAWAAFRHRQQDSHQDRSVRLQWQRGLFHRGPGCWRGHHCP